MKAGDTSRRLIPDAAIIARRAKGEGMRTLAREAGINYTSLRQWLLHPNQVQLLDAARRELNLLSDIDRMEAEKAAAPPKRKRGPNKEKPEDKGPDPAVWDRPNESYSSYVSRQAARGNQGKLLIGRRSGPILW